MNEARGSMWSRLRDRKIVQWGLAYLAGAWVVLQVLGLLAQPFAWPDLILRATTVLLGVGFLAALVLAWYHGERGAQRVSTIELVMLTGILVVAGVGVTLVARSGKAETPQQSSADVASPTNSIAVLPFENMSSDPEQEYFSSGITEEILNALAKIPDLRVPARTSSLQFKGLKVDAREVGRKLNVAHVLEGSVRKAGARVRITVQLINAADGYHLWSETYDRELQDVLAVQDEIARAVAEVLKVRLSPGKKLVATKTHNVRAYELYLKGRYAWTGQSADNYKRAIALYQQAIELDPGYAEAYVGLTDAYVDLAGFADRAANIEKGRAMLARALQLDPANSGAHASHAYLLANHLREYDAARAAFKRALELDDQNAIAHADYARFLSTMGNHDDALRHAQRAVALDPTTPWITRLLGHVYYRSRNYDQAVRSYRQAVKLDPTIGTLRSSLVEVLARTKQFDEAIAEARVLIQADSAGYISLARALALAGRRAEAEQAIARALRAPIVQFALVDVAAVYGALGDLDKAFATLDRAIDQYNIEVVALAVDPRVDELRTDPRFQLALRKAGLAKQ